MWCGDKDNGLNIQRFFYENKQLHGKQKYPVKKKFTHWKVVLSLCVDVNAGQWEIKWRNWSQYRCRLSKECWKYHGERRMLRVSWTKKNVDSIIDREVCKYWGIWEMWVLQDDSLK